jgi:hypothetical protein
MKSLLLCILCIHFSIAVTQGQEHLLLVASEPTIAPGKTVTMDVYLYNEGSKAVKLPPLEYLDAEWVLDDTRGHRLGRSGGSSKISGYTIPNELIAAGAVLHRSIELDIKAEPGDVVTVKVTLGTQSALSSNNVLLYCPVKDQ